ncbi:MAG: ParB N-terminal domain-containing protein [Deltaproteobacteria bacterium]|nr:ParB N-terminal domain-containing protein [Deltaproteobacteria bacterium]MBI4223895.1 ParB N-terminal domain-containing protein [Deltaproteobacteria bacterium]
MDEICEQIQIVPLRQCLMHEGIIPKLLEQIAGHIKSDGVMKNPIIVTKHKDHYVILDGMHRFAALQKLQVRDILVFAVDYQSEKVILEPPHTKEDVLKRALTQKLFPPKSTRHVIAKRPLRLDIELSLLKSDLDPAAKNQRLQTHIQKCYADNRVRFYPESVLLFFD